MDFFLFLWLGTLLFPGSFLILYFGIAKGRLTNPGAYPEIREWKPKAILTVIAFCGLLAAYLHRIYT